VTAEALPGVGFAPETFTPDADRYARQRCSGVHVTVRDRAQFEPVRTGLAIARALRSLYAREWEFDKLDRLLVAPEAMRAIDKGLPVASIVETYQNELTAFAFKREKYLLYSAGACGPTARVPDGP
jgi:uncharacterized protein YbbC (DUF1343 family)